MNETSRKILKVTCSLGVAFGTMLAIGACFPDLANPEADVADTGVVPADTTNEDTGPEDVSDGGTCTVPADCPEFGTSCVEVTCTTGVCSTKVTPDAVCDDGLKCTVDDRCSATGACAGEAKTCSGARACESASCDEADGTCVVDTTACKCTTDADCDDDNGCTIDSCSPEGDKCINAPDTGTLCDDGAWCTTEDTCDATGACVGTARTCGDPRECATTSCDEAQDQCVTDASGCECESNIDCTSEFPCAVATCDGDTGACVVDTSGCECLDHAACDDQNPCTLDLCTSSQTCSREPRANGITCGAGAVCVDGACADDVVLIPAGYVRVGCDDANDDCPSWATPTSDISFDAYLIDRYEVKTSDYRRCVMAGSCTEPDVVATSTWSNPNYEEFPINHVDWNQANAYCAFENKRLCSEAEWERAARGAANFKWPWGNTPEPTCDQSNLKVCGLGFMLEGGAKIGDRSPAGVFDMLGNAHEWVADCYLHGMGHLPLDGTPYQSVETCLYRVRKGSSYVTNVEFAALYNRRNITPATRHPFTSIRCCKSL